MASDAHVISLLPEKSLIPVDITDIIYIVSDEAYSFAVLAVFIIITVLLSIAIFKAPRLKRKRSIISNLSYVIRTISDLFLNIFELVIDQENFSAIHDTQRVLWSIFAVATFTILSGYFCNFMSTDLVAERPYDNINELSDLLKDKFAHVMPIMQRGQALTGYMLSRENHTPEYQTVTKSIENGFQVYLDKKEIFRAVGWIMNGSGIGICSRFNWESKFKVPGCAFRPKLAKRAYVSKESFADGTENSYFNKRINRDLLKAAIYRIGTVFEIGLMNHGTRHAIFDILASYFDVTAGVEYMECINDVKEKGEILKNFKLAHFARTFRVIAVGSNFAVIVLILEIFFRLLYLWFGLSEFTRRGKPKRRQRKVAN